MNEAEIEIVFTLINSILERIKRLEAANIELMKERTEMDENFLLWSKSIHAKIDELKEAVNHVEQD